MFIYKVAVLIWIITISTLIIILEKNKGNKYLLLVTQIYNFITGFLSWAIYFISIIFFIKYSRGALDNSPLMGIVLPILPVLLLLIPINVKVKKRIDINKAGYITLSIFVTLFGLGMFIFISNLLSV